MNFIDFIIILSILIFVILSIYHQFIRKKDNRCKKCPYNKINEHVK